MKRHRISITLWCLAMLCVSPAMADVVADWNELAAAQGAPPASMRDDAEGTWSMSDESNVIVAVAMFQAVNTIERRYEPYREAMVRPNGDASETSAALAAAHAVLVKLFPGSREPLDQAYALALAGISDSSARQRGIEVGESAAAQLIQWREKVRPAPGAPYRPLALPGRWVPTSLPAIAPYAVLTRPWLLSKVDQFRPGPPPPLNSAAWARDFNETKSVGALHSTTRTAERGLEAQFWSMSRWDRTVRQVADRPNRSLAQNARLYALVGMVSADLGMALSDGKMTYLFWRPVTAIRNGDQDGNDATTIQADWVPLLPTPPHPEYPCAHCAHAMGLAALLEAEGPPPAEGIAITSYGFPNAVLYVPSYRALVEQMAESRIFAGAHFRSSVNAGKALGRQVAEYALNNYLKPIR